MNNNSIEDITRAIYILRVAAKFIREHAADRMTHYDEADCDGYCLADDCEIIADTLGDEA